MKLKQTILNIKCDTVLCNSNAMFCLETNSYKGNTYLCEKCFEQYKNLFKGSMAKKWKIPKRKNISIQKLKTKQL